MILPGILSIDDQVGVKHAEALDHLVGPEGVVDDHKLGDQSVEENGLEVLLSNKNIVILIGSFCITLLVQ